MAKRKEGKERKTNGERKRGGIIKIKRVVCVILFCFSDKIFPHFLPNPPQSFSHRLIMLPWTSTIKLFMAVNDSVIS
jgi:hypothetical protein